MWRHGRQSRLLRASMGSTVPEKRRRSHSDTDDDDGGGDGNLAMSDNTRHETSRTPNLGDGDDSYGVNDDDEQSTINSEGTVPIQQAQYPQSISQFAQQVLDQMETDASRHDSVTTSTTTDLNDLFRSEDFRLAQEPLPQGTFSESTTTSDVNTPGLSDTASMSEPSRRNSLAVEDDEQVQLVKFPTARRIATELEIAFGAWATSHSITQIQWQSLKQILENVSHQATLTELPTNLNEVKRIAFAQLPLLSLYQKSIPVSSVKQPTFTKSSKSAADQHVERPIFFFDAIELVSLLVQSPSFRRDTHIGMAHFVDEPSELFHSRAWASSVRASSGQYAYYTSDQQQRLPLFPSDIIYYKCSKTACGICSTGVFWQCHTARVLQFGKDYRSAIQPDKHGDIMLLVQDLLRHRECSRELFQACHESGVGVEANEFIIAEENITFISPDQVVGREDNFFLDYNFGLPVEITKRQSRSKKKVWIRRIWDGQQSVRPLNLSHPVRGELELAQYGRKHFLSLAEDNLNDRCISLPFLCFIDEFGLYRNMYRSLLGVYWIPAGMSASGRHKRQNVFTLTLGPHGAAYSDVIKAIAPALSRLDRGIEVQLDNDGPPHTILAFTLAFLGDMPQQEKNSGFLGHSANLGCRFCLVSREARGNLDFDIKALGRYHHINEMVRAHHKSITAVTTRNKFGTMWGISEKDSPLPLIAPALDSILTRPSDPAHSEFKGIGSPLHQLLVEAILDEAGAASYHAQLQNFPFPPGWSRLQSPIHHLKSYTLSENARATIIIPLLLRSWLTEHHVRRFFLRAIQQLVPNESPVNTIVSCFARVAKTTSVMASRKLSQQDRNNFRSITIRGREAFKILHQAAIRAHALNPHVKSSEAGPSQRGRRRRQNQTPTASPASSRDSSPASQASDSATEKQTSKGKVWQNAIEKPNFHIILHAAEQLQEYASINNASTIPGEDKHKPYKGRVTHTNHHLPEKSLLHTEAIDRTLQFVLDGVFLASHPDLTRAIRHLAITCPSIFKSHDLTNVSQISSEILDGDAEEETNLVTPPHFEDFAIRDPLPMRYVETTTQHPLRLDLLDILHPFNKMLRAAYQKDWENISMIDPGSKPLTWCCKLVFTTKSTQVRQTLQMHDFVELQDGRIVRIILFFIHVYNEKKHVFALVSPLSLEPMYIDPQLQLPIWKVNAETEVIGFSAFTGKSVYMVPIQAKPDETGSSNQLSLEVSKPNAALQCTWEVRFV